MCWAVSLLHLFILIFHAGELTGLDEGRFLWAPKNAVNHTDSGKSMIKPGRWTRSIFNWLHSPLINSIQEAFVIDSVYENLEPVTKCVKRCVNKASNDLKLEESFENEFFLWEDNEGNPLEFGLKQIQQLKPYPSNLDHVYHRLGKDQNFWEESLFYEDNRDVKDIDMSHLSYHEKLKLNDLKGRMHSFFQHIIPHRHSTKSNVVYYTLHPPTSKNDSVTKHMFSKDFFRRTHRPHRNFIKEINKIKRKSDNLKILKGVIKSSNKSDVVNEYRNNFTFLDDSNISPLYMSLPSIVNKDVLNKNYCTETDKTKNVNDNSMPITYQNLETFVSRNVNLLNFENRSSLNSKPLLDFDNVNHKDEDRFKRYESIGAENFSPPIMNIENSSMKDIPKQRNLRTAHLRELLRFRRNGKRKHPRLKHPQCCSVQYEILGQATENK